MSDVEPLEHALKHALDRISGEGAPPRLAEAMRAAVFPGGARIRPRLCLAVADACGDAGSAALGAATALEFMHCASLVHDDLPCFDDADRRRNRPTVHRSHGEPIAVLAGDALIVLALETVLAGAIENCGRAVALHRIVSGSVGMPSGICAGQAWESEPVVDLRRYQQAKTGALFVAATTAGAVAAGADPAPWRVLGERLGEAYQVADDLKDAFGSTDELGKPIGKDTALNRPNACGELGAAGAVSRLEKLIREAVASIPECDGADALRAIVMGEAKRLAAAAPARAAA